MNATVALLLNDDLRAKNAAKEEAEAELGVHLALKLPGLEYYRNSGRTVGYVTMI